MVNLGILVIIFSGSLSCSYLALKLLSGNMLKASFILLTLGVLVVGISLTSVGASVELIVNAQGTEIYTRLLAVLPPKAITAFICGSTFGLACAGKR